VCVRQDGLPGLSRRHGSPDRLDRQVRLASCLSRCKGGGLGLGLGIGAAGKLPFQVYRVSRPGSASASS